MPVVVEEIQIVDREHDGHAGIERQILACLVRDVPEVIAVPPLEGREKRPVEAGECLLPPRADLDLLDTLGAEVPDRLLGQRLRQEKDGIKGLLAECQDAISQVPTEPAEPTVGVTKLFEVEHDTGPVGPSLPLCERASGEHGGTATRLGRTQHPPP